MQSSALSPTPMSSRFTRLLFWYVVSLSKNDRFLPPGKSKIRMCECYDFKETGLNVILNTLEETNLAYVAVTDKSNHLFELRKC